MQHLHNFYCAGAALLSKEGSALLKRRESELRKVLNS
jgi:hypothetical protein